MIVDREDIDSRKLPRFFEETESKDENIEKPTDDGTVKKDKEEEIDGGYGWVVVFAVFFVHVFVLGNVYSFGIFYTVYLEYFDSTPSTIAWIGGISAALMTGFGVYSGKLADYYGNNKMVFLGGCFMGAGYFLASFSTQVWQLYLTQGLIVGIGYSLAFISGVSAVGQWFTKNRGLAVGVAVAGSGLGQFCMAQVVGTLIDSMGWRGALKILALIEIVGVTLCALLIKRRSPLIKEWSSKSHSSWNMLKDRNFSLIFWGGVLASLGMFVPFTYIPAYAMQYNLSKTQAVFILSFMGIASATGRITTGFLADRIGKLFMLQLCYLGGGVATAFWLLSFSFTSILIMGMTFAFFIGGVISLMPNVAAELYGVERLASLLGVLYSATAIGNLLSAPIGGFLLQGYHSYGPAIIASSTFQLGGLCLVLFVQMKKKNKVVVGSNISPADNNNNNDYQPVGEENNQAKSLYESNQSTTALENDDEENNDCVQKFEEP
jgi:MFS family permease